MNGENSCIKPCHVEEPSSCKPRPPLCNENLCSIPYCDEYRSEEIMCKYKDAVVSIQSEFILIGFLPLGEQIINNTTELGVNQRYDHFVQANGFFVEGKYIIAPSQAVLLPPSLTAISNRYPFFEKQDLATGEGPFPNIQDVMIRATRILVTVYNVNGKGKSFVYEADLVGVDGAGDIAVLKINMEKCWNETNPCVQKCHPHLSFGSSRSSIPGEKIFVLSEPSVEDTLTSAVAIYQGLLANQKFADPKGIFLQELLALTVPASINKPGGPILNAQGQVLGMYVGKLNKESPVATSEFFMRRIILEIIKGICPPCENCHLEVINDPLGPYYRYKKAYLGLGYNVANGLDYDVTKDYGSVFVNINPLTILSTPRVRLDENGKLLNSPLCKQQIGVKVVGVAGMNPPGESSTSFFYVPGGFNSSESSPLPENLPVSPFINRILPGDIITHINNIQLGELYEQVAPGLITWNKCAGESIHLCFRRGGNASNTGSNSDVGNYESWYEETGVYANYPKALDYPAYVTLPPTVYAAFSFDLWSPPLSPPPSISIVGGAIFQPAV